MSCLELYAYSTDQYLKEGIIKVGHTKLGRTDQRVKEQFGTSNPEVPKYVLIGTLPRNITDKDIHNAMIMNDCEHIKDAPGKEWFKVKNKADPFEEVKKAYNKVVYGSNRPDNFTLREEQESAVNKAKKWLLKEYSEDVIRSATHPERFLINAKMRFGKCFTSIHLAKSLNSKNTLIVTYKPDVIGEWIDTVNNQVAFDKWKGIRAKKKKGRHDPCLSDNGEFPSSDGPIVMCVSLQDLWIGNNGETKKRLHKIPNISWDLIIFDEVHYGSRTERAKDILDKLDYKYRLDLSGTPFRLIEQDDFCSQQVFTYSYLDEQERKNKEAENDPNEELEGVYRQLPDLSIATIEITERDIQEQRDKFETDDIDFSLNALFETQNGEFIHEDAVSHFIDGLCKRDHDARAVSVFGKLGEQLGCPAKRHSVWWMNRVDSISALIEKLKKHPYFSRFELINASGSDSKKNDDDNNIIARDKSVVQQAIQRVDLDSSKLGTITFTCGRFLTGVTIREWESIMILSDVQSAESYYQAIFRVQSAWVDKKSGQIMKRKAWVFDFAITRCLKVTYDCASNIADQVDQQESFEQKTDANRNNLEIITEGLCESLDIKRFYQGRLIGDSTSAKDIFEVLNHEGSKIALARRITSNVLVNFSCLKMLESNPELLDILKKVKGYRTQEVAGITAEELVKIGVDASDLEDVKNDPNTAPEEKEKAIEDFMEKEKDKERQSRKKWYATQIKRLAICMADFIYMTMEREYNIDDVIQTKSPEFFEVMTGISKDDFVLLCDLGFMNRFALNRIVREFRDQEDTSLNPEEYIYESLKQLIA
ncbi:type III restriction enzyme, res subunit [Bacteriovorax sp. BAL6_X]|uniref:DEAD/DEAH box helicase family protein n=1 Tax=Bacteriovorax sp. BAL6_X TaxID=1201290 RepID=UPI00038658B5|nr:DEAD/DEAH box helicase family protein [Bacteriovorax sp. BAL6_X]EPZ49295.1 type III restriction enzyme, res subunit [Bacteriovorax sp. BAL6_X]